MNPPFAELLARGPALTDGAWATELQRRGQPIGGCPDAENLSRPESVEAVARAYTEAGSRVLLTNTFGANRLALERHGLADQMKAINRAGVEISRRAAGGATKVFGAMGPGGRVLATGDVSEGELAATFSGQAEALAGAGADALVLETHYALPEAVLAVRAAKATGLPVVACVTFGTRERADRMLDGTTPEGAAEALATAGADAVGVNCGFGPETFPPLVRRLRAACGLPLWAKPNAGLPEMRDGRAVYSLSPGRFAEWLVVMAASGADFVGGCCGVGPAHIAAARALLEREA